MAIIRDELQEFIAHGKKIAATHPRSWYMDDSLPDNVPLNPGYMSFKKTRLCIVNLNPSLGTGKKWVPETYRQIERWATEGSLASYKDWYYSWLEEHFIKWPAYQWISEVLSDCYLEKEEISWLNVCKMPTKDATYVSRKMASKDFPWLNEQLGIIRPDVILVGTLSAQKHLNRLNSQNLGSTEPRYDFQLAQNRNRNKRIAEAANEKLVKTLIQKLSVT